MNASTTKRPLIRTRRGLAAWALAVLVTLGFAGPAQAVDPVDLGGAAAYSVLASVSVTSTGATAMSENLGVSPGAGLVGTPIVLGETHLNDSAAAAAQTDLTAAFANAKLRSRTELGTGDFIGRTYKTGVYGTSAAMGFSGGTLTLDAESDPAAVFIFQIGGALSIAASTTVTLVNGAQACNVFWQVDGAITIGATANFAGTLMTAADVTVGAGSRVDGRLLTRIGAVTLAGNAIRTSPCPEPPVLLIGPAGPAGPAGADGTNGTDGARGTDGAPGATGAQGPAGPSGADGHDGVQGATGAGGAQGVTGLIGAAGLTGATGLTGVAGTDGLQGAAGVAGTAGAQGVTGAAGSGGAQGTAGTTGAQGVTGTAGTTGAQGTAGTTGAQGVTGLAGANGLTGATGLAGAAGQAGGPAGPAGQSGADGAAGAAGLSGENGKDSAASLAAPPVASGSLTTILCVTHRANRSTVRRGGRVKWTVVVKNCGAQPALGVSVSERLPKGEVLAASGSGLLVNGRLRWTAGGLSRGASKTYRFTTRFSPDARAGRYVNRATAAAENTLPATGQVSTSVRR